MPKTKTLPIDHPGEIITEELEARGWSQSDLAFILGIKVPQLNTLLTGKSGISKDLAVALGDAFDMQPEFFANLQTIYDLSRAKKSDPGVKTRAFWRSVFPVREMINRGWIEETEPDLLDLQMMRFFDKNRVPDIPFVGDAPVVPHAAKKSGYENMTSIQYAWLHRVKKIAESMDCPLYSEQKLRANLASIRAHMTDLDDLIHIPEILRKCGVRFVLVEALHGSKIDGVCLWIGSQPVIGMSLRMNRLDNFCFVLRHECEHVLLGHGKEYKFAPVDEIGVDYEDNNDLPEEVLANDAAEEFCVPRQHLQSFILRKSPFISESDVLGFAARMEIHPAIIIGQIQNKTKKYAWLRKYQTGISQRLMDWKHKDGWGFNALPTGL